MAKMCLNLFKCMLQTNQVYYIITFHECNVMAKQVTSLSIHGRVHCLVNHEI